MVCLSPKCYLAYDAENDAIKCGTKGVPGSAKLCLQDFKKMLYDTEVPNVEVRSLRCINGQMARVTQTKRGLSDLFSKFRIDSDKITCRPLIENNEYL